MIITVRYVDKKKHKVVEQREACIDKIFTKDGVLYAKSSLRTFAWPLCNVEKFEYN